MKLENRYIPLMLADASHGTQLYEIHIDCEPWRFGLVNWAHDTKLRIGDEHYRLQIVWNDEIVTDIIGIDDIPEPQKTIVSSLISLIFPRPNIQWYLAGYCFDRTSALLETDWTNADLLKSRIRARNQLRHLWHLVKDNPKAMLYAPDFEDDDESDE